LVAAIVIVVCALAVYGRFVLPILGIRVEASDADPALEALMDKGREVNFVLAGFSVICYLIFGEWPLLIVFGLTLLTVLWVKLLGHKSEPLD
jgi:hypothetical protein